jgi:hypothetical protein
MHPLAGEISSLKDGEIETKISDLTKKYFMTSNPGIKSQIAILLENYRNELTTRRNSEWQKMVENRDKGLDKLINIS